MCDFVSDNRTDAVEDELVLTAQSILDALREGLPADGVSRDAVNELGDALVAVAEARKERAEAEIEERDKLYVYSRARDAHVAAEKRLKTARGDVRRGCKRVRDAVTALFVAGKDALPADAYVSAEERELDDIEVRANEAACLVIDGEDFGRPSAAEVTAFEALAIDAVDVPCDLHADEPAGRPAVACVVPDDVPEGGDN